MVFVYFHFLLMDKGYIGYMCVVMKTWWNRKEV